MEFVSCNGSFSRATVATILLLVISFHTCVRETGAFCTYEPNGDGHVTIPPSDKTISDMAFFNCTSMRSISIPDSVNVIGNFAFAYSNLESILIPKTLSVIGNGTLKMTPLLNVTINAEIDEIPTQSFADCTSLISVILPSSLKMVSSEAFAGCSSMTSLKLPDGVEILSLGAFKKCTSLKSINFPTSLRWIGDEVFMNTDIREIIVGKMTTQIGSRAFANIVTNIVSVKVEATDVNFGDSAFSKSGLTSDKLIISKDARSIRGLANDLTYTVCLQGKCTCVTGYGNTLNGDLSEKYFRCAACEAGKANFPPSLNACELCPRGTYAQFVASATCTPCSPGRFGIGVGSTTATVCQNCPKGSYNSFSGMTNCQSCPPGSYCNDTGLSSSSLCPPGSVAAWSSRSSCTPCGPGTYQSYAGSVQCYQCVAGTFNMNYSSISNQSCVNCAAGRYASKNGSAACSLCPEGTFNPRIGQSSCMSCGNGMFRSSADRTICEINEDYSGSLVDSLFLQGGAYYVTFIIVGVFLSLAGIMTYKREMQPTRLGVLTRFESFVKSFLPGFSFGSEMLLMFGIWTERPDIAVAMFFFRLFHAYGLIALCALIFGSKRIGVAVERWLPRALDYTYDMDHKFARENVPLVGTLLFVSLCDITYIQFLPWKKSRFFIESKGFPDMHVMIFSLGIKASQAFISLVCVATYLYENYNINSPTTSLQAKILFFFNIVASTAGVIMGILLLVIKNKLLSEVEVEKELQAKRRKSIASMNPNRFSDILSVEELQEFVSEIEEQGHEEVERRISATYGDSPIASAVRRVSATLEEFDGSEASHRNLRASIESINSIKDALRMFRETVDDNRSSDGDDLDDNNSNNYSNSRRESLNDYQYFENPMRVRQEMQRKDNELKMQLMKIEEQQKVIERLRIAGGHFQLGKRRSTTSDVDYASTYNDKPTFNNAALSEIVIEESIKEEGIDDIDENRERSLSDVEVHNAIHEGMRGGRSAVSVDPSIHDNTDTIHAVNNNDDNGSSEVMSHIPVDHRDGAYPQDPHQQTVTSPDALIERNL